MTLGWRLPPLFRFKSGDFQVVNSQLVEFKKKFQPIGIRKLNELAAYHLIVEIDKKNNPDPLKKIIRKIKDDFRGKHAQLKAPGAGRMKEYDTLCNLSIAAHEGQLLACFYCEHSEFSDFFAAQPFIERYDFRYDDLSEEEAEEIEEVWEAVFKDFTSFADRGVNFEVFEPFYKYSTINMKDMRKFIPSEEQRKYRLAEGQIYNEKHTELTALGGGVCWQEAMDYVKSEEGIEAIKRRAKTIIVRSIEEGENE